MCDFQIYRMLVDGIEVGIVHCCKSIVDEIIVIFVKYVYNVIIVSNYFNTFVSKSWL